MSYGDICLAVEKLKNKYHESDPAAMCEQMGIRILHESFGTDPDAIKGYFLEINRTKSITVNDDLQPVVQRIIIAHELGHAALHHRRGIHAFHDVAMFDESSDMEREANLFAAEFLLNDDDVLDMLNRDTTFFAAASELYVPFELLDFKFRVMKWKGYKLVEPPITARNNFLRDFGVPDGVQYN